MYEISLVPDVKAELLKKLRIRNLVIFICLIVAAGCGVVIFLLLGVTGSQGIALSAMDTEIACRADGVVKGGRCDTKYGTAVLKFTNAEELLTIQDQMNNLRLLNDNKIKFSRVFGVLDVILPTGDNEVKISQLRTDINNNILYFDAVASASNNIGYRALEAFKKNAKLSYYDYGSYMRLDKETGDYVEIPSFCIDEEVDANGVTFGIYHKGKPGCEAPMIEGKTEGDEELEDEELETETQTKTNASTEESTVTDIRIRRTYNDQNDMEKYRSGKDNYGDSTTKGYYFESSCLQYDNGKFDEAATLEQCPLLSEEPNIGDSSYGRNSEDEMVLSFSSTLTITRDVFLARNKHVQVIGPTRQNVTDSYIQVRDMFTEAADKEVNE
ncbi:hypothetical protein J6X15_01015 [Candidatus Saccharibacteria bacterium]|nr:hypothetical protein [Candidatus Saccharibacteria bacterium]